MDEERPPEPRVERVEKPDGRYVLYFSWAEEQPTNEPPADVSGSTDE